MDGKKYKYYRSCSNKVIIRLDQGTKFCFFFIRGKWRMVSQIDLENNKFFEEIPEEEVALTVLNNEI